MKPELSEGGGRRTRIALERALDLGRVDLDPVQVHHVVAA